MVYKCSISPELSQLFNPHPIFNSFISALIKFKNEKIKITKNLLLSNNLDIKFI